MNTPKQGEIHIVIIRDPSKDEFVGFCYEFAIVKYGDDLLQLKKDLVEASRGYLRAVNKVDGSPKLLNSSKDLPDDFQKLYKFLRKSERNSKHETLPRKFSSSFKAGDTFLVPACV